REQERGRDHCPSAAVEQLLQAQEKERLQEKLLRQRPGEAEEQVEIDRRAQRRGTQGVPSPGSEHDEASDASPDRGDPPATADRGWVEAQVGPKTSLRQRPREG